MARIRDAIVASLTSLHPSVAITEELKSHIEHRFREFFHDFPIPGHPPYALMIHRAIIELDEEGGSTEEAISGFIKRDFGELPWAHASLLNHHLGKLCANGDLELLDSGRYKLLVQNGESRDKVKKKRRNRGRPQRCETRFKSWRERGKESGDRTQTKRQKLGARNQSKQKDDLVDEHSESKEEQVEVRRPSEACKQNNEVLEEQKDGKEGRIEVAEKARQEQELDQCIEMVDNLNEADKEQIYVIEAQNYEKIEQSKVTEQLIEQPFKQCSLKEPLDPKVAEVKHLNIHTQKKANLYSLKRVPSLQRKEIETSHGVPINFEQFQEKQHSKAELLEIEVINKETDISTEQEEAVYQTIAMETSVNLPLLDRKKQLEVPNSTWPLDLISDERPLGSQASKDTVIMCMDLSGTETEQRVELLNMERTPQSNFISTEKMVTALSCVTIGLDSNELGQQTQILRSEESVNAKILVEPESTIRQDVHGNSECEMTVEQESREQQQQAKLQREAEAQESQIEAKQFLDLPIQKLVQVKGGRRRKWSQNQPLQRTQGMQLCSHGRRTSRSEQQHESRGRHKRETHMKPPSDSQINHEPQPLKRRGRGRLPKKYTDSYTTEGASMPLPSGQQHHIKQPSGPQYQDGGGCSMTKPDGKTIEGVSLPLEKLLELPILEDPLLLMLLRKKKLFQRQNLKETRKGKVRSRDVGPFRRKADSTGTPMEAGCEKQEQPQNQGRARPLKQKADANTQDIASKSSPSVLEQCHEQQSVECRGRGRHPKLNINANTTKEIPLFSNHYNNNKQVQGQGIGRHSGQEPDGEGIVLALPANNQDQKPLPGGRRRPLEKIPDKKPAFVGSLPSANEQPPKRLRNRRPPKQH